MQIKIGDSVLQLVEGDMVFHGQKGLKHRQPFFNTGDLEGMEHPGKLLVFGPMLIRPAILLPATPEKAATASLAYRCKTKHRKIPAVGFSIYAASARR